jgi:hypothetical protein
LKPIVECSEEERATHDIVEKDGNISIKYVSEESIVKPLSECSDAEKSKNDIVEKDGTIMLNVPKEKVVK